MTDLFAEDLSALDTLDPEKDYHSELVGEGKKYKDEKALAYSRVVADNHIKQLEAEQAALRRELDTRINMEKFLTDLNSAKSQLTNQDQPNPDDQPKDESALTPQQLEQLVATKLTELENRRTAQQNTEQVMDTLRKVYGPNYVQKLRQEAADLNMSEADIKSLAARNPRVLYKLLGVGEQTTRETFEAAPRTQVNSFSLPSSPKRGYSWYWNNIYKNPEKGPNEFYSPKVQNEMAQAMQDMGKETFLNS